MDALLPIVNQLQVLYSRIDDIVAKDRLPTLVDLPQVAVVGAQSVGKSSILEAIIGEPILPRGNGMVTRCPLILQLKNVSEKELDELVLNGNGQASYGEEWRSKNETGYEVGLPGATRAGISVRRGGHPGSRPSSAGSGGASSGAVSSDTQESLDDEFEDAAGNFSKPRFFAEFVGGSENSTGSSGGFTRPQNVVAEINARTEALLKRQGRISGTGGGIAAPVTGSASTTSTATNSLHAVNPFARKSNASSSGVAENGTEKKGPVSRTLQVSEKPIVLKISTPRVVDLTLIDLPGLIRVPTADQPPDIDEQIMKIVLRYIENPNCIILAVSAANVDLANSDSLRVAREVDPVGQRTIGVLTKTDLVDDAAHILQITEGRVYPLRRGYVPVRCLGQREVATVAGDFDRAAVSLDQSLTDEAAFFHQHPVLSPIAAQCGIKYLAQNLNSILIHHIRLFLPGLKTTIDTLLTEVEQDVRKYGVALDPRGREAANLLLQIFTKYSRIIDDLLDGRATPSYSPIIGLQQDDGTPISQLVGGARLHYVFQDWFAPAIMKSDALAGLPDAEIRAAIRNASGLSTALFVPEAAFEMLVRKQICLLEQPAVQCVHQAVQEMLTIAEFPFYQLSEFKRFPELEAAVRDISKQVIFSHLDRTLQSVTDFIRVELAFINKSHPDFVGGKRAISMFLFSAARNTDASSDRDENDRDTATLGHNPHSALQTPKTGPGMSMSCDDGIGGSNHPSGNGATGGTSNVVSAHAGAGQAAAGNPLQQGLFFWRRHPLQQAPAPPPAFSSQLGPAHTSRPSMATRGSIRCGPPQSSPLHGGGAGDSYTHDRPERDRLELELVKALIVSYFEIVKKTLADVVPKKIMYFLVNASREAMHRELVTQLYREEHFEALLKEAPNVPETRERALAKLDTLQQAHRILNSVSKDLIVSANAMG